MEIRYLDICNQVPKKTIQPQSTIKISEMKRTCILEMMDGELVKINSRGVFRFSDGLKYLNVGSKELDEIYQRIKLKLKDIEIVGVFQYVIRKIVYKKLPSYFFVISINKGITDVLSWEATKFKCTILGLYHLPEIEDISFKHSPRISIREILLGLCNRVSKYDSRDTNLMSRKVFIDSILIRDYKSFDYRDYGSRIFLFRKTKSNGYIKQVTNYNFRKAELYKNKSPWG